MRVVAGTARGRKLVAPDGNTTRPTSDRVREAMFNALASLDALDGARGLDLFAGTGALGIEALSRGAAHVTFVEPDRAARACVEANLANLGFDNRARVVATTAARYCAQATDRFDLVWCDPPYAHQRWAELLAALADLVAPDGRVVAESADPLEAPEGWMITRQRAYGGTVVTVLARVPRAPNPLGDPS